MYIVASDNGQAWLTIQNELHINRTWISYILLVWLVVPSGTHMGHITSSNAELESINPAEHRRVNVLLVRLLNSSPTAADTTLSTRRCWVSGGEDRSEDRSSAARRTNTAVATDERGKRRPSDGSRAASCRGRRRCMNMGLRVCNDY